MKRTKTYSLKKAEIDKVWHVLDAEGQTLGRLSTEVARLLMGKHKPTYAPHLDMGDFVVVVNAEKIRVTGKKLDDKIYYRHTGYAGGLKETTLADMLRRKPQQVLEKLRERHAPSQQTRAAPTRPPQGLRWAGLPPPGAGARRPEEERKKKSRSLQPPALRQTRSKP